MTGITCGMLHLYTFQNIHFGTQNQRRLQVEWLGEPSLVGLKNGGWSEKWGVWHFGAELEGLVINCKDGAVVHDTMADGE
jgi:hypothetical protein